MNFRVSELAEADLVEIWSYYAIEKGDPDLADRILDQIQATLRKIARTPGIGHQRTDLADPSARFWKVHSYLIIYREAEIVEVSRILHAARDISTILREPDDK